MRIQNLAGALFDLQNAGKYTVHFDYAGHVSHLSVSIYRGKWRKDKDPIFAQGIYTDRPLSEQYDNAGKLGIPQMTQYIRSLMPNTPIR